MSKTLKILFIISEADPLVKVGGLGDVGGSLPHALSNLPPDSLGGVSLDIRLALPFHTLLKEKANTPDRLASFSISTEKNPVEGIAYQSNLEDLPLYLIDGEPVSAVSGVYCENAGQLGNKYIFFSLAVLHLVKTIGWQPDVIHAHDWHAAISLYALDTLYRDDPFFERARKIITIHNLPYLGLGAENALRRFQIPAATENTLPRWASSLPLPLGLLSADQIIAVSPTYAQEIMTPDYGCGLEGFLKTRSDRIAGILNGLDIRRWDPATDPEIAHPFSLGDTAKRSLNKKALCEELALEFDEQKPLLAMIGRLDNQKGVDLVLKALKQLNASSWQMVILGTGKPGLEKACVDLQTALPEKVRSVIRFDSRFSRRLYAGADLLLMPSRYEPCGIAQMIAMRYGCIPLARATGGLKDSIQDAGEGAGTGFLFKEASVEALTIALRRALQFYQNKPFWIKIQQNAMQQDFTWQNSARKYAHYYLKGVAGR